MDDLDDTVNLCPMAAANAAEATLILSTDESLPDLVLPSPAVRPANEPDGLWNRLLDAFLRAMAPWPV